MSNPKILFLLSGLKKKELEDFRQFLRMPLVNTNSTLFQLLDHLIPMYPGFPEEQVEKEAIHAALFPKQAYKEKRIRSLFSDLAQKILDYYSWRALSENHFTKQFMTAEGLRGRGLSDLATRYGGQVVQKLDAEEEVPVEQRHLTGFQLHELLLEENDNDMELAERAQHHLDQFFMLSKLRLASLQVSRKGYLAGSSPIRFLETLLEEKERAQLPIVGQLYHRLVGLLANGFEESAFEEAKTLFFQEVPNLKFRDRRALFQALLNISVRVSNEQGTAANHLRTWDLYQQGLRSQAAFMENGELSETTFTNIVINGAVIGEFEKAEQFIRDYVSRLAPEIRENAVELGLAYLHYHQKDYDKVIGLLQNVVYTSVSYAVRGRSLLLRTYFDQATGRPLVFSDPFYSLLEAFYRYVRRNKELSPERKETYLNFVSFTKSLAQVATAGRPYAGLGRVKENIAQSERVALKEWLLERAQFIERY
ncbi:MAG: hypothetical protein H6563_14890 [Lewinellaceae bacterium]|nr:hypothetical protein [Lewinellaceae bacterium]